MPEERVESRQVLDFWFDGIPPEGPIPSVRLRLWFNGGGRIDREIEDLFGAAVEAAGRGEYDGWQDTPRGSLALIILLDQFPRNIHRHTPAAYAFDPIALKVCLDGLDARRDLFLATMEKAFFYLPLEHAEDLLLQERSVALFSRLLEEAPPALSETCRSFLDYAERHREIIARFGRFPHRNRTLGRESTPEETEFLKLPGSSF